MFPLSPKRSLCHGQAVKDQHSPHHYLSVLRSPVAFPGFNDAPGPLPSFRPFQRTGAIHFHAMFSLIPGEPPKWRRTAVSHRLPLLPRGFRLVPLLSPGPLEGRQAGLFGGVPWRIRTPVCE